MLPGAAPGFQVSEAHLKKIAPSAGRREDFWVFRVKNHDYTPKNHIFSNFRGARRVPPPLPWIRPWLPSGTFNAPYFHNVIQTKSCINS